MISESGMDAILNLIVENLERGQREKSCGAHHNPPGEGYGESYCFQCGKKCGGPK